VVLLALAGLIMAGNPRPIWPVRSPIAEREPPLQLRPVRLTPAGQPCPCASRVQFRIPPLSRHRLDFPFRTGKKRETTRGTTTDGEGRLSREMLQACGFLTHWRTLVDDFLRPSGAMTGWSRSTAGWRRVGGNFLAVSSKSG